MVTMMQVREGSTPQRPRAHVVWLKDGEVIVTENDKKYRHYRKKKWLLVNNVSYSDMGEYQCGFSVNDTQRGTSELWSEWAWLVVAQVVMIIVVVMSANV